MRALWHSLAIIALSVLPAAALELSVPGNARLTHEEVTNPGSYDLPVAPFSDGVLPVSAVEGAILRQAWKIDQSGMTSLQIVRPLQEQLEAAGYRTLLDCGGQACGGFDFRFSTSVLEPPFLYVDLFDFRFLSARKEGAAGDEVISVLASQTGAAAYVQIIRVTSDQKALTIRPAIEQPEGTGSVRQISPLAERLVQHGHVILGDLNFESGSASLGEGSYASLEALAGFLLENSERRIALVGHTDAVGSLDRNTALSRKRAESVLARLVEDYGVPAAQLDAEGVGYLSPIAPNSTPGGRDTNRRVEAVLLTTP